MNALSFIASVYIIYTYICIYILRTIQTHMQAHAPRYIKYNFKNDCDYVLFLRCSNNRTTEIKLIVLAGSMVQQKTVMAFSCEYQHYFWAHHFAIIWFRSVFKATTPPLTGIKCGEAASMPGKAWMIWYGHCANTHIKSLATLLLVFT